ncbi:MAG: hypothetical protein GY711_32440 [bacterium]|nr:hypothetical protein [bacterium]
MKHLPHARPIVPLFALLLANSSSAQCSEQRLQSSTSATYNFTRPVVDGDTLAVGNTSDQPGGAVSVFQDTTQGWVLTDVVRGSGVPANAQFGFSIAIDRDRMAVGSAGQGVWVFERSGLAWVETGFVGPPPTAGPFGFGNQVELQGNRMMVGSYADTTSGTAAGAVHVYELGGQGWQQVATLTASDANVDDLFGVGIGVEGAGSSAV